MPYTIRLHRIVRAPAERVYRAFLDPDALVKWQPPRGYTGRVHGLDAVVGGAYRMSFTSFAGGESHSFGGRYLELVPGQRIVCADRFDDPDLPGEIRLTVSLRAVSVGVELEVVQEHLPDAIPQEACYLGWQESLDLLALLVEAEA